MYETIKKFLEDGGKCLLIENGKPVGVVLTMEEYDRLKPETPARNASRSDAGGRNPKSETKIEELPIPKIESKSIANSIGEAMVKEMDFSEVSADPADINLVDAGDVTLEDLGLDPDIQLPKDF